MTSTRGRTLRPRCFSTSPVLTRSLMSRVTVFEVLLRYASARPRLRVVTSPIGVQRSAGGASTRSLILVRAWVC